MDQGPHQVTKPNQSSNYVYRITGVRLRVIRSVVERERAQTTS